MKATEGLRGTLLADRRRKLCAARYPICRNKAVHRRTGPEGPPRSNPAVAKSADPRATGTYVPAIRFFLVLWAFSRFACSMLTVSLRAFTQPKPLFNRFAESFRRFGNNLRFSRLRARIESKGPARGIPSSRASAFSSRSLSLLG